MLNYNKKKNLVIKLLVFIGIILSFMCINTVTYATIRGDADSDATVTAYDAYCVLTESINDPPSGGYPESTIQLIDMDCDTDITSYDAYSILKKSIEDTPTEYITPEDFGAVGDGVTDDTAAFRQCMNSNVKNVILSGDYLITGYLSTSKEKHFYNGKIISESYLPFTFSGTVSFKDTIIISYKDETGPAAHYLTRGEVYQHTSSTNFVEVWGDNNSFEGCVFHNANAAIRGRISTGQGPEAVPQNLYVNHCRFTESKMPIAGYFAHANVNNSSFRNDGDLYSGEHCIYLETVGQEELNIRGCLVETYNTDSGSSFQVYGKNEIENLTTIPAVTIENCTIYSNSVVACDYANVVVRNVHFETQFIPRDESGNTDRTLFYVIEGTVLIDSGYFEHLGTVNDEMLNGSVILEANNATFRLKKEVISDRGAFPHIANNCTFINWGGWVVFDNTRLYRCIFTRDLPHVTGNYYIGIYSSQLSVYLEECAFKAGDNISWQSPGYIELKNCHYVNNIGQYVTNYQEIGTIHEDIVD